MANASLQLWTNGEDFVIAASADDAEAILVEHQGVIDPDDRPEDGWSVVPPERTFPINFDDGEGRIVHTVAEWIASEGRGFLASENY